MYFILTENHHVVSIYNLKIDVMIMVKNKLKDNKPCCSVVRILTESKINRLIILLNYKCSLFQFK